MKFTSRVVWSGTPSVKVYILPSYPKVEKAPGMSNLKVVEEAIAYVSAMLSKGDVREGQALVVAVAGGKDSQRQLSVFAYDAKAGVKAPNPMIHYQRFDGEAPVQGDAWVPVSEDALRVFRCEAHHRRVNQRAPSIILNQPSNGYNHDAALRFQLKSPIFVDDRKPVDDRTRMYLFGRRVIAGQSPPPRARLDWDEALSYFRTARAHPVMKPGAVGNPALTIGCVYPTSTGKLGLDAFVYGSLESGELRARSLVDFGALDPWSDGIFCETEGLMIAAEMDALRSAQDPWGLERICRSFPELPGEFLRSA